MAFVLWGVVLTILTEALSLSNLLEQRWVALAWGIVLFVSILYLVRVFLAKRASLRVHVSFSSITHLDWLFIIGIAIILVGVGLAGLIAAPNNADSMVYHLSRVAHWAQNESVAHYPTHITRQIKWNPWSEFAILHMYILVGGDRLAFIVQWLSMLGSVIGVSLIAEQLKANKHTQILAALVCATLPSAILQGSSTQNDFVLAFWLVCFVYLLFLWQQKPKFIVTLALGASLGLAILTKMTAYIYAFPFLVWLILVQFRVLKWRAFASLAVLGMVVILINLGHSYRNFRLYGNLIGPVVEDSHGIEYRYTNDVFGVSQTISNLIRNTGLHLGTPLSQVNAAVERGIELAHKPLNVTISDSRTTWAMQQFHILKMENHEDRAGNLLHLGLIFASIIIILINRMLRSDRILMLYMLCLLTGFVLFSAVLKLQVPWNTRLHLPLFVLWSPLIAIALSSLKYPAIANVVGILLLVSSLLWMFTNETRPLIGNKQASIFQTARDEEYFKNYPWFFAPYSAAARTLASANCSQIGLLLEEDDMEYPFWMLLKEFGKNPLRIEHVMVSNASNKISKNNPYASFNPCGIIVVNSDPLTETSVKLRHLIHNGRSYSIKWNWADEVVVYMR